MTWKKVWLEGDNRTLDLTDKKAWPTLQKTGDVNRLNEKPHSVQDFGREQVIYARTDSGQTVKWIRNDKELKATKANRFYKGPRQRPSSIYE